MKWIVPILIFFGVYAIMAGLFVAGTITLIANIEDWVRDKFNQLDTDLAAGEPAPAG